MITQTLFILLQSGPPGPSDWGDPDALPIDTHIWILIIAPVILGCYTLYKNRTKQSHVK